MKPPLMPSVLLLLLLSTQVLATELYWTPAHDLAPGGDMTCPAAGDLDGDSDSDVSGLLPGPVRHYWNVGTPEVPEWELDLTQFPNIPSCYDRTGAFGDVDLDGDLDLAIGSFDSFLRFCWNVGTPQEPQWLPDQSMFEGVPVYGGGTYPSFGDLDADGDLDLTVAGSLGNVGYIENTGTVTEPAWAGSGSIAGVEIRPGGHKCAALGDLDADGDLDIVGLSSGGAPQCWENIGTPEVFEFAENPSMLMGVDGPSNGGFGLVLVDIDADGDLDLLIAGWHGENFLYRNNTIVGGVQVEPSSWGRIKALYR